MADGSYEQRDSGTWSVRYKDAAGKPRRQGGFRTKADAKAWNLNRLNEVAAGIKRDPNLTFGQFVEKFMAQKTGSPDTIRTYNSLLKHAVAQWGHVPLHEMADQGMEIGQWRLTLSDGARHDTHAILSQVLNQAVKWKLLTHNPARDIPNPKRKGAEIHPFESWADVLELEAVIAEHFDPVYRGLATIVTGTGLRPQEWPKVRLQHVEWNAGVLALPTTVVKPKTPARRVPVRPMVMRLIEERRGGTGLLLPAPGGGPILNNTFRRCVWYPAQALVNELRAEQGLPPHPMRRPYDMRHTFATWYLRSGLPTFNLARRMGTSLEMIEKTYGHFAVDSEEHEQATLHAYDEIAMAPEAGHPLGIAASNALSQLPIQV